MTYGRARLWLGISGVGSLVLVALGAITSDLPTLLLDSTSGPGIRSLAQLAAITAIFMLWLAPLDFLGGYWLPRQYGKSRQTFGKWLSYYLRAAATQALLFVFFGAIILLASQWYGIGGGIITVGIFMIACVAIRNRLVLRRQADPQASATKLLDAMGMIQSWQIYVPRCVVVEHEDVGFTGGVIGFGARAKIVIPRAWLAFPTAELATAIARRSIAVSSGSYTRGFFLAFTWNMTGFFLCALLPNGGLDSVAGLVTTMCGFTLWSFLGLLTLPTVSRNASLRIDQSLEQHGLPAGLISRTAMAVDQLQDDEPTRPALIEAIFHPVPSVTERAHRGPVRGMAAWNVARTTLFLSWACLGLLSRSVHCNLGRPELWTMLPTD